MKKLLLISTLVFGLSFGVKPVPRDRGEDKQDKPGIKIESVIQKLIGETKGDVVENDSQGKVPDKNDDHFQDVDSNSVNDQRENDLLKIKQLKTKFKDLLKKKPIDKNEEPKKPTNPPKKKSN